MVEKTKKLTMGALILMIFTSVYGFNNMPRSFYLMGYGAIPFFLLSAVVFFVPFAFMVAEYGSSGIMVPLSNAIFGKDTTADWTLFGLKSTQTLGILGVVFIIAVTFFGSKGLKNIQKVASIGGIACMFLNVMLIGGALLVLIGNKGELAQPITSVASFVDSPNPEYAGSIAMLAFLVYALFAYGGTEAVGGLVDETENPEKNFGKGLTIAAIIVAVGYSIGIFCVGIFTNWSDTLSAATVHKGNASYVIMNNLGYQIGAVFGASQGVCVQMGNWAARIMGISILLSLSGAVFTLSYSVNLYGWRYDDTIFQHSCINDKRCDDTSVYVYFCSVYQI